MKMYNHFCIMQNHYLYLFSLSIPAVVLENFTIKCINSIKSCQHMHKRYTSKISLKIYNFWVFQLFYFVAATYSSLLRKSKLSFLIISSVIDLLNSQNYSRQQNFPSTSVIFFHHYAFCKLYREQIITQQIFIL